MTIAHLQILLERIAKRLGETAFNLSFHLLAINGPAYIMHTDNLQHLNLSCEQVHFDLNGLCGIPIAIVRCTSTCDRIKGCGARWTILLGDDEMRVISEPPLALRLKRSLIDGSPTHKGHTRRRSTSCI